MLIEVAMVAVQTDPELLSRLGRIATAQTVIMICVLAFAGLAVAGALLSYGTMKTLSRTLRALEKVIDELAPRAEPLIDGVTRVAVDTSAMTEAVRRKVNDVLDTVEDVNDRLRSVTDHAEERLRQFGAVLDVVQAETEDMLLDATATARGVQHAAETFRQLPMRPPPPRQEPVHEQEIL